MTGNPSMLKRMYEGRIETINSRVAIGTGEPVGRFFLNKYWKDDMDMKQMAELGYFIVKVIMEYDLENTVGLSSASDIRNCKQSPAFILLQIIHAITEQIHFYRNGKQGQNKIREAETNVVILAC